MSGQPLAAVLWDMDGTLVDSEPIWIRAQQRLVAEHGGSWTFEEGLTLVGTDMDVTAQAIQAAGVRLPAERIIRRLTDEVTAELGREVAWRPGAFELVSALQEAGIPQAIVTTSPLAMTRLVADALPPGAVHTIVAGEHVQNGKPDPEPYLTAARNLGVEPASCIAIEDSPTGLAAAIAAGTVPIGVPNDADLDGLAPGWTRLDSLAGVGVDDLVRILQQP